MSESPAKQSLKGLSVLGAARRSAHRVFASWMLSLGLAACTQPGGDPDTLAITRNVDAGHGNASPLPDAATPMDPAAISGDDGSAAIDAGTLTGAAGAAGQPTGRPTQSGGGTTTNPNGSTTAAQSGGQSGSPAIASDKPVLFWLDFTANAVWRANADGTSKQSIAFGQGISTPDSIAVDVANSYVYWTNMGTPLGGANIGSLQRLKLDGTTVETVVPIGTTNTPKQMAIDTAHSMLYWCDQGANAKVWRSKLDGGAPQVLLSGHNLAQLAGIALDLDKQQFYFSDRMARKIYRAGFELPAGETGATRSDLEELFAFSAAAMPSDLDLDLDRQQIYWTDRTRGTVQRAPMNLPARQSSLDRTDIEVLATNVPDVLGITLDHVAQQLYFTQLNGDVWSAELDGTQRKMVVSTGSASGVTLVRMP